MTRLVLAIAADRADSILDGKLHADRRTRPPRRLPARAYLAVPQVGVVGECVLAVPERHTDAGWLIPVSDPKRYAHPKPLSVYGLAKTPRSFRYLPFSSRGASRTSRG
jgi:predicted transcriptional regulator